MYPIILHIHGEYAIRSYGTAIFVGLVLYCYLTTRLLKKRPVMTTDQFYEGAMVGLIAGVAGGRLLDIISTPENYHSVGEWFNLMTVPGLSIQGALCGVVLITPLWLRTQKLSVLAVFDVAAVYAGILQGFGRIGCFLAGCCYGLPSSVAWAVTYTHPESIAPLCTALHPTQLYSAGIFFLIAAFMQLISRKLQHESGASIGIYLMLASLERFSVDFWRDDRNMISTHISEHQIYALIMLAGAATLTVWALKRRS